jgi:hypothetical protein
MRERFNALPKSMAQHVSFILDTTTIECYMPSMGPGDFDQWGKRFFNTHKGVFGGKLEVAVALQRHPLPIYAAFQSGGTHDITLARNTIFREMQADERGLGDPGYGGQSSKIYAPPRRNERGFVAELDKQELTLQRRVEMANAIIKRWLCLGSVYRKGAVRAYPDLELLCSLIPKIVFFDLLLNQDKSGMIHTTGPTPDPAPLPRPIPSSRSVKFLRKGRISQRASLFHPPIVARKRVRQVTVKLRKAMRVFRQ